MIENDDVTYAGITQYRFDLAYYIRVFILGAEQRPYHAVDHGVFLALRKTDPVFPYACKLSQARADWQRATLPGGPGMVLDRTDEWWEAIKVFMTSVS